MKFQDWIWVYLGTGEAFTRWTALLFYGVVWAIGLIVLGGIGLLAMVMLIYR